MHRTVNFKFSGMECVVLALILLIFPLRWIMAWILAAAVHELFHVLAVIILGGSIRRIEIGLLGTGIYAHGIHGLRSAICSLAGPVGAVVMLGGSFRLPMTAVCAILQSFFNLMPLPGLDGGNALLSLLERFSWGRGFCKIVAVGTVILLWLAAVWCSFLPALGLLPVAWMAAFQLRMIILRNNPCNRG